MPARSLLQQIELMNLADPVTMAVLPVGFAAMLGINPESITKEMLEKLFGIMVGRYVVTSFSKRNQCFIFNWNKRMKYDRKWNFSQVFLNL